LQAASLFAAIRRRLGIELPITTILHATTVRELARHIEAPQGSNAVPEFIGLRDGADASLYLIHEGNGQALLYAQLAALLPAGVRVTAVQPPALPNVPMAADGVQQLAAHYRQLILHRGERQPIFVGGLCAGGVIAQELARQLTANGKPVAGVVMFDAAVPGTPVRDGDVWGLADTRFRTKAQKMVAERGLLQALPALGRELVAHLPRAAGSRLQMRRQRQQLERQLAALSAAVSRGTPWPADLPPLSAMQIYVALEKRFRAQRLFGVPCTLIKATQGAGVDRPLGSVYGAADLGWSGVVDGLRVVEVPGGHASMFQPPHVHALATQVTRAMRLTPAVPAPLAAELPAAALQAAGGAVSMKL
jgi:thioesterase domain-containing protein